MPNQPTDDKTRSEKIRKEMPKLPRDKVKGNQTFGGKSSKMPQQRIIRHQGR